MATTTAVTDAVKQTRSRTVISTLHSRRFDSPGAASAVDLSSPGECFRTTLLPPGEVELQLFESRLQLKNALDRTSMKTCRCQWQKQRNRRHQISPPMLPRWATLSIRPFSPRLCENITSSTKPEVHNVLHCRQIRAWARATCRKKLIKSGHVVFEICKRIDIQADKHTFRQTHRDAHRNTSHPGSSLWWANNSGYKGDRCVRTKLLSLQ